MKVKVRMITYLRMEIDKGIVEAVYNNAAETGNICYQIRFNNGMADMTIEPEKDCKVF